MGRSLAYAHDERMLEHVGPTGHPERPDRLRAAWKGLEAVLEAGDRQVPSRLASRAELERVHEPAYLDAVQSVLGRNASGLLDDDTFYSPGTGEAALLAAAAAIDVALAVWRGEAASGLALVRPPGHHAERSRAMGFCLYDNIACAAAALLAAGCKKLAVVDWDVHHGNGTQDIFYGSSDVLFVSLHQWPLYPGTGLAAETGDGAGQGATINVPLPAGSGDERYAAVFAEVIVPRLSAFAPELVLISAGYDAALGDPLADMALTPAGYTQMVQLIRQATRESARDRLVGVLEGGYDLVNLETCVAATARAFKA